MEPDGTRGRCREVGGGVFRRYVIRRRGVIPIARYRPRPWLRPARGDVAAQQFPPCDDPAGSALYLSPKYSESFRASPVEVFPSSILEGRQSGR